jgi:MFS family permease
MVRPGRVVSAVGTAVRNDRVRRAELAWSGAIAAEWAHFVALGIFAYQRGGTAAVGVAGLIRLLPAAAIAPFAASFGDRFRRERFLAAVAVVGSGALAASAVGALAGNRPLVFGCAALVGVCTTLVRPALQALLPSLARTAEELVAANGATSIVEGVGTLVGPVSAGILVSSAGVATVFSVAAGVLLIAAATFARVRPEGRVDLVAAIERHSARQLVGAGFRAIVRESRPRLLIALVAAQCFVRGSLNVLVVVAVFRIFRDNVGAVGYLIAAIGVGGLIGALGATTLRRLLAFTFGVALIFWGLPIVLIAARPSFVAALLLLAIVGAANSVEDVAVFTLLQRTIPNDLLTRVLGIVWGLAMGGVALGSIAAPAIVRVFGPRPAFAIVGSILPLVALAALRRLLEIDRSAAPAPELELLDRVPMFAPLSIAAKERLAANLVPVAVGAGERIIRAGDHGDRLYIVGAGELEIDAGDFVTTAGSGACVGEIALLRDVPRTATVTASLDSQLYTLDRAHFLAALTGHDAASAAGHELAEARLAEIEQARAR